MSFFTSRIKLILIALFVSLGVYTVVEIKQRYEVVQELAQEAKENTIPRVQCIFPQPGPNARDLILPGDIYAWYQAPIYAQVSGYVKRWFTDYGANVKAGDILAIIETPSLDAEYEAAKANLNVAQTRYELAKVTAKRWQALSGTKAVSQQEVDVQVANAKVQKALVDAARHEVARYEALQAFKYIRSPFNGVVTSRRTDIGDFVNNNGDLSHQGKATELFTVSDIQRLRVFVNVPQDYASILQPGLKAELMAPQYPGRIFKAHFLTSARAFNVSTRTVTTELTVDNVSHLLWPGTFVKVHFTAPVDPNVLIVPEQALIFRAQGMQLAVVQADNRIKLHKVQLGHNLGKTVQILSGIHKEDRIVNNPSAGLLDGQLVKIVDPTPGYNDDFHPSEQPVSKNDSVTLKQNSVQPDEGQP